LADQIIRAGVVGWPIGHSRSPLIHNHWIASLGLNGTYEAIAVDPKNFGEDIRGLVEAGYAGVNCTVPHKHAALAIADRVDASAQNIGAANTLVFAADGTIEARNTDAIGFMENLRAGAPSFDFKDKTALVLGAGGAARAIVYGLIEARVGRVLVANRTKKRATEIQAGLSGPIDVLDWADREAALVDVDLLVNTTSLGMIGSPPLVMALDRLPSRALVTDIVYAPLETPLLSAARARGNTTVDGLGMLLHQAAPAFAAWFGIMPAVDADLRQLIIDDLEKTE
jgi:shikimate dehydrogenase